MSNTFGNEYGDAFHTRAVSFLVLISLRNSGESKIFTALNDIVRNLLGKNKSNVQNKNI